MLMRSGAKWGRVRGLCGGLICVGCSSASPNGGDSGDPDAAVTGGTGGTGGQAGTGGSGGSGGTAGVDAGGDPPLPPLFLSELMYHPVLEDDFDDHHEFVELHNAGDE